MPASGAAGTGEGWPVSGLGPPPKPDDQRARRNRTLATTRLPAAGRQGDPPPWPLLDPAERELELWSEIWRTPQATQWALQAWTLDVAVYVRHVVLSERMTGTGWLDHAQEARMLSDRLGLNPLGLVRLRWELGDDLDAGVRRPGAAGATRGRYKDLQVCRAPVVETSPPDRICGPNGIALV